MIRLIHDGQLERGWLSHLHQQQPTIGTTIYQLAGSLLKFIACCYTIAALQQSRGLLKQEPQLAALNLTPLHVLLKALIALRLHL
jgi:hypothetical protein